MKGQSVDNLSERAQGDGRCLYILSSKQTEMNYKQAMNSALLKEGGLNRPV